VTGTAGTPAVVLPRGPFEGTMQILRFNWPQYLAGAATSLVGLVAALLLPLPAWLRVAAVAAVGLATFWLAASVAVSWYVYDRSGLTRWTWLREVLGDALPATWANVHTGFDETTVPLIAILGGTWTSVDIYDPATMTEPSIRRARARYPAPVPTLTTPATALPFADGSQDAVFALFAAHEIRDPALRDRFFADVARVLRPSGVAVLVEHVRDAANAIAFGPGVRHFHSPAEWRRASSAGGLVEVAQRRVTPFVRCSTYRRA
jgi:SAM-dependent methyltransferase